MLFALFCTAHSVRGESVWGSENRDFQGGGSPGQQWSRQALNPQHNCSSCTPKGKFLCSHRNEGGNQKTESRRGSMIRACGCLQSMWYVCVKDKESVDMESSL